MNPFLKSGDEHFFLNKKAAGFQLKDFWAWSQSDLLNNTLRGQIAEFLVKQALEIPSNKPRVEWDAYDLVTDEGIKIEVKSAAYVQSWTQIKDSYIKFDICPKKGWNAETNKTPLKAIRVADFYIFCLLHHKEKATIDPLDLDQWTFYILQKSIMDTHLGTQKSISLSTLHSLNPVECRFDEIKSGLSELKMDLSIPKKKTKHPSSFSSFKKIKLISQILCNFNWLAIKICL